MTSLFGFLNENSNTSSIRLSLLMIVVIVCIMLLSVAYYIFKRAGCEAEISSWTEMGVFVGGIATLVTGMAWQKVAQKKFENHCDSQEKKD